MPRDLLRNARFLLRMASVRLREAEESFHTSPSEQTRLEVVRWRRLQLRYQLYLERLYLQRDIEHELRR